VGESKAVTGLLAGRFDIANEGRRLLIENVELARRLGDLESFCFAAQTRILQSSAPQHAGDRSKLAEELIQKSRARISARLANQVDALVGSVLLELGQRRRAGEFFDRLKESAERTGQSNLILSSIACEAVLASLDGRLEDAVAMAQNMQTRGEQLGLIPFAASMAIVVGYMPLLLLGRLDQITQLFGPYPLVARSFFIRANAGEDTEVATILDQMVVARPGIGSADDETQQWVDILMLQGAIRIGHRRSAELLLQRFAGSGLCATGILFTTCIPRHLGTAAALLGRPQEARKYYDEALKVTAEMKFRPELALTRLHFAELLLEHYQEEKDAAKEHLDFAIGEFREMKMQPSLDRALQLVDQSSGLES
jgi:tetratricopeptide (TPR) repeat protein